MKPEAKDAALRVAADHYGVSKREIMSMKRTADVTAARDLAGWLLVSHGWSYNQTGKELSRAHTTIMRAHNRIERQRAASDRQRDRYDGALKDFDRLLPAKKEGKP